MSLHGSFHLYFILFYGLTMLHGVVTPHFGYVFIHTRVCVHLNFDRGNMNLQKRDRERERRNTPHGAWLCAIAPPFLHPVRTLNTHAHMPGVFLEPPWPGFELCGQPCGI